MVRPRLDWQADFNRLVMRHYPSAGPFGIAYTGAPIHESYRHALL